MEQILANWGKIPVTLTVGKSLDEMGRATDGGNETYQLDLALASAWVELHSICKNRCENGKGIATPLGFYGYRTLLQSDGSIGGWSFDGQIEIISRGVKSVETTHINLESKNLKAPALLEV